MSANAADRHTGSLPCPGGFVPDHLSLRWEDAYNQYVRTVALQASGPGEARVIAEASASVAAAWRAISDVAGLPWWGVTAVRSAAETFDEQAEQWRAFATYLAERPGGAR
ncbi:hypothetical protein [Actinokineospora pegani]|uniref:hypothetical protein n=1 Tax=Actinokineospora pegani TaxID=2654637 RepID=UPI0012EAB9E2|nr:hypothetical protein [Actinokineospora pegani]